MSKLESALVPLKVYVTGIVPAAVDLVFDRVSYFTRVSDWLYLGPGHSHLVSTHLVSCVTMSRHACLRVLRQQQMLNLRLLCWLPAWLSYRLDGRLELHPSIRLAVCAC